MPSPAHSPSTQKGNRPQMWKQVSVSELDEDELPAQVSGYGHHLHRRVRRALHEVEAAAKRLAEPKISETLRRYGMSWQWFLAHHNPTNNGRCQLCRTRWGNHDRWPCLAWKTAHMFLVEQ